MEAYIIEKKTIYFLAIDNCQSKFWVYLRYFQLQFETKNIEFSISDINHGEQNV